MDEHQGSPTCRAIRVIADHSGAWADKRAALPLNRFWQFDAVIDAKRTIANPATDGSRHSSENCPGAHCTYNERITAFQQFFVLTLRHIASSPRMVSLAGQRYLPDTNRPRRIKTDAPKVATSRCPQHISGL